MTVAVYIASSVDGFIAEKNGGIDWLHDAQYAIPGEDFGYVDFMRDVDCLVMGRNTYEKVLEFDTWPFAGKRVVVLSRTLRTLPEGVAAELSAEAPVDMLARLRAEGVQKVYVDGGQAIRSFLRAGLVTELTLTVVPVLLGAGLSLFGELGVRLGLRLGRTRAYANGFVQMAWQLK